MSEGIDLPNAISASQANDLAAKGIKFIGRYYSQESWKRLTPAEAVAISKAGIYIVSIYEDGPIVGSYFNSVRGSLDAGRALDQAAECGQPKGSGIIFTVDYDAPVDDVPRILVYAGATHSAVKAKGYRCGFYGSGAVLQAIKYAGCGDIFMLAESTGWRGYQAFKDSGDASIIQSVSAAVTGFNADGDVSSGDAGGWLSTLT